MAAPTAETSTDPHKKYPFLAHHFDTPQQQFDSGKLGIWLFLLTEVLFFSGLFVAYGVYRYNHPEVFLKAHEFLNTTLGAANTCVLLFSSLTMAWAVRAAQLNQKKLTGILLAITLACAGAFLVVKYFEYTEKFDHGLSPVFMTADEMTAAGYGADKELPWYVFNEEKVKHYIEHEWIDHYMHEHNVSEEEAHHAAEHSAELKAELDLPPKLHVFFGIYYFMTGLHAIHILGGMGVITWIMIRSFRGEFSSDYFGPVDYVGLYWHLVDLIWIYLFPLLYLIRS